MKQTLNITDLHFGNKNNSVKHNNDLLEFAEWIVDSKEFKKITELRVLGDVFHHRDKLDVDTINKSMEFFEFLSKRFNISMVIGNHDMYYRDRRDVHSLKIFTPYAEVIDYQKVIGDELLTSWLITEEEYADLVARTKKDKIKRVSGHFEFSTFAMNDHYVMEHGQTHRELQHVDHVFTGHYHKRQEKDNVVYVGTPMPFDFNDSNDTKRGLMVTDDDGYKFHDYNKVKVISVPYKEFIQSTYGSTSDTTIRVVIDESIDEKVMDQIKEKMEVNNFRDSRIQYKFNKNEQLKSDVDIEVSDEEVQDIDALVVKMIGEMDEGEYNNQILSKIYKDAMGE